MKPLILTICSFLSLILCSRAQDTVFVAKHTFPSPVRNVFNVGEDVYVKTGENLYILDGEEWETQKIQFKKAYVFYKEGFYESDFIPNSELFDAQGMKDLIPQRGLFITTSAAQGSRFFLATGSSLYEYQVYDYYSKSYFNTSIRNIFINDSIKVIATYSGIFVNDSIKLKNPGYSNGPLTVIDDTYFLNSDELFLFYPPDSTVLIKNATNTFAGNIRKTVVWKGKIYSQNTQSINLLGNDFELNPIHKEYEYLDLEPLPEGLVFSTSGGKCLFFDGNEVVEIVDLGTRIRDIYPTESTIYLAADDGVYSIESLTKESLKKISDTRLNVHVEKDNFGNIWLSTENGLYLISKDYPEPLTLIPSVEFNRDAFFYYHDTVYAGAVDGLYILNAVEVSKSFIPAAINKLIPLKKFGFIPIALGLLSISLLVVGLVIYLRKRKINQVTLEDSKANKIDLQHLEGLIVSNKINSVEGLANFLDTNTVQLNRNFSEFNITPGKFLKRVKLRYAKKLLEEGSPIEEVANRVGYSIRFLKNELENDN